MSTQPKPTPKVQAIECPNCGGTIQLRGFGRSLSAVCIQCLSIIDTQSPTLQVLQQFQAAERVVPLIPLGKRGKLHGDPWEVIGFQCRQIVVDSTPYEWREYVLFNPYKGYRYLTEYDGHWNDVKPINGVPEETTKGGKRARKWLNQTFTHFQASSAETTYVMGEFPWQVRVGERAFCDDYISPPLMLSSEKTDMEVTWSLGEYTTGDTIWKAFELPGAPPAAKGIYANQPSPHQKGAAGWSLFLLFLAATFVMLIGSLILMSRKAVFRQTFSYTAGTQAEASALVTPVFQLEGRTTNVEVEVLTDLDNQWAYFSMALINEQTGQGYDFGREVGYYHGVDGGESWTEGKKGDSVVIGSVPSGRYYLLVQPEMDPAARGKTMRYEVHVRRDVPDYLPFVFVPFLLLIPPIIKSFRKVGFESRRWQESSYAGGDE
jgi:hypothetical protein